MEESEKSLICENFYALITSTSCDSEFLWRFKEQHVFSSAEVQTIVQSGLDAKSQMDQAYLFYSMILKATSRDTFEVLVSALTDTNQAVPFNILNARVPKRRGNSVIQAEFQNQGDPNNNVYVNEFKRTRGRHCDLPSKYLREAAMDRPPHLDRTRDGASVRFA